MPDVKTRGFQRLLCLVREDVPGRIQCVESKLKEKVYYTYKKGHLSYDIVFQELLLYPNIKRLIVSLHPNLLERAEKDKN